MSRAPTSFACSRAHLEITASQCSPYFSVARNFLKNTASPSEYGTYLIRNLAQQIEPEYGSGFGERQLKFCRQFYREYPIVNTLRSQLKYGLLKQFPKEKHMHYVTNCVDPLFQYLRILQREVVERQQKIKHTFLKWHLVL